MGVRCAEMSQSSPFCLNFVSVFIILFLRKNFQKVSIITSCSISCGTSKFFMKILFLSFYLRVVIDVVTEKSLPTSNLLRNLDRSYLIRSILKAELFKFSLNNLSPDNQIKQTTFRSC